LSIFTLPARIGLLRLLAGPLGFAAGLSPEVANADVAYSVTPRSLQTYIDEAKGIGPSLAQAGAITSLGAVPLIVLSRGQDQEQDWQEMQADLLNLSSNSQHMIADQSGHNIQLDQPEAAVKAIVTMVEHIRRQAAQ
jgi:pimeloyl-ACP methyl ester carboxylesterase